MGPEAHILYL